MTPQGIIPQEVSFFDTKIRISWRKRNQKRKYFNPLVSDPGWFKLWKKNGGPKSRWTVLLTFQLWRFVNIWLTFQLWKYVNIWLTFQLWRFVNTRVTCQLWRFVNIWLTFQLWKYFNIWLTFQLWRFVNIWLTCQLWRYVNIWLSLPDRYEGLLKQILPSRHEYLWPMTERLLPLISVTYCRVQCSNAFWAY